MEIFTMPDLGEGLTEADLVEWTVAEGDTVELNQVIAEVETAKALVQLPAPFAGVIAKLHVEPGTTVPVGQPIVTFDVAGTSGEGEPTEGVPSAAAPAPVSAGATSEEEGAPSAAAPKRTAVLVGYGPAVDRAGHPTRRARRTSWTTAPPADAAPPVRRDPSGTPTNGEHRSTIAPGRRPDRPRTFPPVRKRAHELGVDLAQVPGSGEDGLITREDLEAWVAAHAEPATGDPAPSTSGAPRETRTPITGVRKHTAAAMVASAFTAPHATEFLTVDVTPSMDLLASIARDRRFAEHRITILTLTAKALLIALRSHPSLNSRWDEEAGEIVQFGYANLGIAAATPRGLLVPNIKDAETLDLAALADAISALTERARAGTTLPADLARGTISITNIGVFGIDAGTPILNPGEAAILAMGAVRRRPWEHHDEIALRSVMTLSLSFDHRLVDGEQASRFLADVGRLLADPAMTITMV